MKKMIILLLLFSLLIPVSAKAQGETVNIYLDPIVVVNNWRIAKYFASPILGQPGITAHRALMDYGFLNYGLVVSTDISPADNAFLVSQPDVYRFPDNLDQPISDKATIDVFFEAINLPTNWMTPSTTYRELLRYAAGMMQFNQRYGGIAAQADGLPHSIFDNARTLDSNWNSLSAQEKGWFNETLHSFGFPQNITGNPKLRTLAKQAGDLWGANPFYLGGIEF